MDYTNLKKRGRWLRLGLLLTLLIPVLGYAQDMNKKISLKVNNEQLSQALLKVEKASGYYMIQFSYNETNKYRVTADIDNKTAPQAVAELLSTTPLTYSVNRQFIRISTPTNESGKREVSGRVTDTEGNPLPGTTVIVRGQKYGTTTSSDGSYTIRFDSEIKHPVIQYSFIGMATQEVPYHNQRVINIILAEDANTLDDVVVTGYGTYNRGQYVGAVSQVNAEDIQIAGDATIDQMLQGIIPGMSVINTTGKVGGTPKIRIRGTSTLLGNQEPLWVVDDVIQTDPTPIPNDASPLSSNFDELTETAGNAISWLNPADIETITVLKDASATAIYGSQAANGVIVITTKKAKEGGGTSVNYSGNATLTQRPSYGLYDMMNSQEYMQFQQQMWEDRDAYTFEIRDIGYAGLISKLRNKQITREEYEQEFRKMEYRNTDWFDLMFRTAFSTNHNISLSTSTEKVSSRISLGINSMMGEAKGNDQLQFTASSNTTFRLNKKLYIDLQLNGSYRQNNDFAYGVSPYEYAMNTTRAIPVYNEDGTYFYHDKSGVRSYSIVDKNYYNYNILNEIDNTGKKSIGKNFQAALNLHWDIVNHLQFQGSASLALANSNVKSWATEYSEYISAIRGYEYGQVTSNSIEELSSPLPFGGLLNSQNSSNVNYSFRGALVYNNLFAQKHAVTFNIGAQATSNKMDGETFLRYGYLKYRGETFAPVPERSTLGSATGYQSTTDLNEQMRAGSSIVNTVNNQMSEYLTAVYSYDNRYTFNMNARLDASNRFGQDENKRFNPSFSLGAKWRLGEEHYMDWARQWFDMFDVSFSYGWRGNAVTSVSPYLIARDGGIHQDFRQYYLSLVSLPYPDLGWEKTRDWNFGLDMSFLDGRISAGLNVFNKKSNVLYSRKVAAEYGVDNAYVDGTTMRNKGYEITVSATPIRTKDWTWSLSFNTSKVTNTVDSDTQVNQLSDYLNGTATNTGDAYGTIYAFDFAGLDPQTGRPTFNKMDIEDAKDYTDFLVKAGSREPDISGGISTSLRYKNFHLRATFALSLGADAYLPQYFASTGAPLPENNVPRYMFDRWRKPGDELYTNIPSIPNGNPNSPGMQITLPMTTSTGTTNNYYNVYTMYNQSTARLASTDFIRCRNISLQYDLPRTWIRSIGMRNAYVTASLTNPFFIAFDDQWDGRDPETASWPARRSVSLSLNLNF